jgi:hypothetical protein
MNYIHNSLSIVGLLKRAFHLYAGSRGEKEQEGKAKLLAFRNRTVVLPFPTRRRHQL